jgi:ribosomal protein S18 acetylase RimI-like enzyme
MYFVQFDAPRVLSYSDPRTFTDRVKKFLSLREGENSYFLGLLPDLVTKGPVANQEFFIVEEDNAIVAAGVVLPNRVMCMTWATHHVIDALVDHYVKNRLPVAQILAPGHVSGYFGRMFAQRTGGRAELGRGERVYQLARNFYAPSNGHLEVATPADLPLVREWIEEFIREASMEMHDRTVGGLIDSLIARRILYLWKNPNPVSMAAWVAPTPHGASINFVYTPPEFRGQGYAKAVSAALGAQMLASGLRYCFILTDINDVRTNSLYQSIGARTLCEFMRCTITPPETPPSSGGLNVVRSLVL